MRRNLNCRAARWVRRTGHELGRPSVVVVSVDRQDHPDNNNNNNKNSKSAGKNNKKNNKPANAAAVVDEPVLAPIEVAELPRSVRARAPPPTTHRTIDVIADQRNQLMPSGLADISNSTLNRRVAMHRARDHDNYDDCKAVAPPHKVCVEHRCAQAINKHRSCFVCKRRFTEHTDALVVPAVRIKLWRIKHCATCNVDVHRDRNAVHAFLRSLHAVLVTGKRAWPYCANAPSTKTKKTLPAVPQ